MSPTFPVFYPRHVRRRPLTFATVPTILMGRMAGSSNGPRTSRRLNSLAISRAQKPGYLGDGDGLYLQVTNSKAKSWIYRFMLAGRRREMGLGPYPSVSLADARDAAGRARALVKKGQDPIVVRDTASARSLTFDQAAERFVASNEKAWRSKLTAPSGASAWPRCFDQHRHHARSGHWPGRNDNHPGSPMAREARNGFQA